VNLPAVLTLMHWPSDRKALRGPPD